MWETKSGAGTDSHPFWTWWSLIYTLSSATFPINVRIIWSDPVSDGSSFCIACVCNHCHWTSQNIWPNMGLMSHISCVYDTFSSYCVSFSMMTILTMIVLGPGHLVRALLHFLKILLVVSVDYSHLVESMDYFHLVKWLEYFHLFELLEYFHLVKSMEYFDLVESMEYFELVESFEYFDMVKNIYSFKLNFLYIELYVCISLTLSSVNSAIQCLDMIQLEWFVNPSALVTGAKTEMSLSAVLTVESRKSMNFGVSPRTGILAKFIILLTLMSATSPETVSRTTTWLKKLVESQFLASESLMQSSNILALLSLFMILPGCLGLIISWSLNCNGETEVTTKLGLWKLNLELVSEEEASLGVALSFSVLLTFPGVG